MTLLTPNAQLKIKHVGLNQRRVGFYNLLKKHKKNIKFINIKKINHVLISIKEDLNKSN